MTRVDTQPGSRTGWRPPRVAGATRAHTWKRRFALGGSGAAWLLAVAFVTVGTVRALPRVGRSAGPERAPAAHVRARPTSPAEQPARPAAGDVAEQPSRPPAVVPVTAPRATRAAP